MQKIYNAFFCFLVVLFLAFQSYTGFVHEWFGVKSKAVKAVDKLIDVSLSSHFGEEATFVILLALAVLAALLAYRGPKSERSPRMSPTVARSETPGNIKDRIAKMSALQGVASSLEKNASEPKLQALLGDFIDYNLKSITAAQSDETADAPHFKTSARLEPIVPIPDGHQLRSWLGGNPRLPDPFAWPERNGVPYDFIGQIDCSELPAKLWGGLGPRKGWLAVFCAAEGSAASKVLYSSELGLVRFAPMNSRTDLFEHYHHRRLAGDLEGWQFGAPEWPVRVVTAPGKGPGWRSKDKSPHDGKVVDLSQAAYAPHSWETAKLLFKVMRHHVSEDGKRARNSLVEKQQALKADDRVELQIAKEAKAFLAELKVLSDSEFNPVRWARVATAAKNWRRLELEEI